VGIGQWEDAAKLPSEKNQKVADVYPWGTEWPPPKGAGNYAGEELQAYPGRWEVSWVQGRDCGL